MCICHKNQFNHETLYNAFPFVVIPSLYLCQIKTDNQKAFEAKIYSSENHNIRMYNSVAIFGTSWSQSSTTPEHHFLNVTIVVL